LRKRETYRDTIIDFEDKEVDHGHHKYSPSGAERWSSCPGSLRMAHVYRNEIPEQKDTSAADRGTNLHNHVQPLKSLNALDEYDKGQVEMCRGFVDSLLDEQKTEKVVYEKHSKLFHGIHMLTSGTLDCVIVQEHQIVIIDWKFGQVPVVPAENNKQLLIYMLMAFDDHSDGEKPVVGYIVQPQLPEPVSVAYLDQTDKVRDTIFGWIKSCERPEYRLIPTEHGCTYCPAISFCPAVAEVKSVIPESVNHITSPAQMADFLGKARIVKKHCEKIEEAAKKMAEEGELPGYEIKWVRGRSSIEDVVSVYGRSTVEYEGCELTVWPDRNEFMQAHLKIRKPGDLQEDFASRLQAAYEEVRDKKETKKMLKKTAKAIFEEIYGDLVIRNKPSKQLRKRPD